MNIAKIKELEDLKEKVRKLKKKKEDIEVKEKCEFTRKNKASFREYFKKLGLNNEDKCSCMEGKEIWEEIACYKSFKVSLIIPDNEKDSEEVWELTTNISDNFACIIDVVSRDNDKSGIYFEDNLTEDEELIEEIERLNKEVNILEENIESYNPKFKLRIDDNNYDKIDEFLPKIFN
ncbi:hypothetical protein [Clostridium botulinum]|uniref:hypothetical protein n=1 Tax=Clostridium botulinum TaxID=1491 RepID=UPI003DA5D95B